MNAELVSLVQQIAKEKDLPLEAVLGAMCDGIRVAYEKQFMREVNRRGRRYSHPRVVATLDLDAKLLKLSLEKTVVENPTNIHLEISLENARQIDPNAQLGSKVRIDLPFSEFSRVAMQIARQEMMRRIKGIEQKRIYELYKDKVGSVIVGQVIRKDSYDNIYLSAERTELLLPRREQVPTENLQKGERVRVYIYEIKEPQPTPEPIVFVSRTHKELLRKLLESEVPEIREGVVEIKGLVRDPGYRSKVAVASENPNIDPAGACIGQQGKRINAITQELRNERVDIIAWHPDKAEFLIHALSPARVETLIMNFDEHTATVIVDKDQLSLAIGRQGRNVSLAARLTSWRIDIRTVDQIGKEMLPKIEEESLIQETGKEINGLDKEFPPNSFLTHQQTIEYSEEQTKNFIPIQEVSEQIEQLKEGRPNTSIQEIKQQSKQGLLSSNHMLTQQAGES